MVVKINKKLFKMFTFVHCDVKF